MNSLMEKIDISTNNLNENITELEVMIKEYFKKTNNEKLQKIDVSTDNLNVKLNNIEDMINEYFNTKKD